MIKIKKSINILLIIILLLNIPITAYAGAPEQPPEMPDWYKDKYCKDKTEKECFELVNDELKEKIEEKKVKKKSPPRKVPTSPYGLGLSILSSYVISQSEYASQLEEQFWDRVDDIDQGLSNYLRDEHGLSGWDDIATKTYNGYETINDSIKGIIGKFLAENEITEEINSTVELHPAGKELINALTKDKYDPYKLFYTGNLIFYTRYQTDGSTKGYFVGLPYAGTQIVDDTYHRFGVIVFRHYRSTSELFSPGFDMSARYDPETDIKGSSRYEKFHHNLNLIKGEYTQNFKTRYPHKTITIREFYKFKNQPLPDGLLTQDNISFPAHFPRINSDHFPELPSKTLYNPNDYSITEVDGNPYIEIDFIPNPETYPGDPVPAHPTTPYLVPLDNPELPIIPVFPQYDPVKNPNYPSPLPGPDPADPLPDPDPGPGPNPDPEPNPEPDPGPGPNPDPEPNPEPNPDPNPGESLLEKLFNFLKTILQQILNALLSILNLLQTLLNQILNILKQLFNLLQTLFNTFLNLIQSALNLLTNILTAINNLISNLVTAIETLLTQLFVPQSINSQLTSLQTSFKNKFPILTDIKMFFGAFTGDGICKKPSNERITIFGATGTVLNWDYMYNVGKWVKPIMASLLWIFVLRHAYLKIASMISDNHGSQ